MLTRRELVGALALPAVLSAKRADAAWAQFTAASNANAIAQGWGALKVGPGGNVIRGSVADDGTATVSTDTFGAYFGKPSTMVGAGGSSIWSLLSNTNNLPSLASETSALQTFGPPCGVWDSCVAPSNSQVFGIHAAGYYFASNDGGATFVQTTVTQDTTVFSNGNGTCPILRNAVAIDPQNPAIHIVGTSQQGTWLITNATNGTGGTATKLVALPNSSVVGGGAGRIICAFDRSSAVSGGATQGIYVAIAGSGVYRSTNGGSTWALTTSSPTNVVTMECGRDGYLYCTTGTVGPTSNSASIWNGSAWSSVDTGGTDGTQLGYICADPNTNGRAVAVKWDGAYSISTNHGASWSNYTFPTNAIVATDVPWLATTSGTYVSTTAGFFDPSQSNVMIILCGIGVLKFSPANGGGTPTYTSIGQGIEQLVVNDLCCAPSGTPIIASWDRPFITTKGFGASAYASSYFPTSGTVSGGTQGFWVEWASDASGTIIGSTWVYAGGSGPGVVSHDNGLTWASWATQPFTTIGGVLAAASSTNWIAFDPATQTIYYTTNGGSTWTAATGAPTSGWAQISWTSQSKIICADRVTIGAFYAWHSTGLFRSTNSGATWSNVGTRPAISQPYFMRFQASPDEAGVLAIAGGTQASNSFYISTNGGSSFSASANVTAIQSFDWGKRKGGASHAAIYLNGVISSVFGTYRSNDLGVTWTLLTDSTWSKWPFGNTDFVTSICASKDSYGDLAIGFIGSGTIAGHFST